MRTHEDRIFYYDASNGQTYSYSDLFKSLNMTSYEYENIYSNDIYRFFNRLLKSIILNKPQILIDNDSTLDPVNNDSGKNVHISSFDHFKEMLENSKSEIGLFTSGTTKKPSLIIHTVDKFINNARIGSKYSNNIWGFSYNPTHMAGMQVFFQAILNGNQIVDIYKKSKHHIIESLLKSEVTHLSGTPTFFRLLVPMSEKFTAVSKVTLGGEPTSNNLINILKSIFPNAKFNNIFASTEAGTIFASSDDTFNINDKIEPYIKIVNNELIIHKSILGKSDKIKTDWYKTGDIVEVICDNPKKVKFISRKKEVINVGGEKVNPNEVESIINSHPKVSFSKVFGKKNSVTGFLVVCQIKKIKNSKLSENDIREYLFNKGLEHYKIPRLINFIDQIETTKTGKIKR